MSEELEELKWLKGIYIRLVGGKDHLTKEEMSGFNVLEEGFKELERHRNRDIIIKSDADSINNKRKALEDLKDIKNVFVEHCKELKCNEKYIEVSENKFNFIEKEIKDSIIDKPKANLLDRYVMYYGLPNERWQDVRLCLNFDLDHAKQYRKFLDTLPQNDAKGDKDE